MGRETEPKLNRKVLRKALRAWEQSEVLGESPFAGLQAVERRRSQGGYRESAVGYGLAVRAVLQEALAQLRPDDGPPDPLDTRWRAYLILTEQYIQGRSKAYLVDQMGIAESTYNHAQAEALDRMLAYLTEWEQISSGVPAAELETARRSAGEVPFMPPAPHPQGLVGRAELLTELKRHLLGETGSNRLALHGLPGVGKTSIAVELCHDPEVRSRFADGVLWAGLGPQPELAVQLHLWELALGFAADELAPLARIEDRARALHAVIGDRSMLLVIDDVWEVSDARLLEVGGSKCATVYTSRLPGVGVELAGEAAVQVPELSRPSGLEMIGRLVPQLSSELKRRGTEIVDAVGGLPLALQLLGGAIRQQAYAGNPRRLIEALDRLADSGERLRIEGKLPALDQQPGVPAGYPRTLEATVALSEEALDEQSQTAFRMLSVLPPKPNSFSELAALRVTAQAPRALDQLVDAGLVEPAGSDRYVMHPVLADYGRQRLEGSEAAVHLAQFAAEFVERNQREFAALDVEIINLLAGLEAAYDHGLTGPFVAVANGLYEYFDAAGLIEQAQQQLLRAVEVASSGKLERELAETLVNLGRAAQRTVDLDQATHRYEHALRLARQHGLVDVECASLQGLGGVAYRRGQYGDARERYEAGLELAEAASLGRMQSSLLSNLGTLAAATGDLALAEERYRAGLASARTTGDVDMQSTLLTNLGAVLARRGERDAASRVLEESLEITRPSGNRRAMSYLMGNLGTLAHEQGVHERAAEWLEQALELARQIGDQERICQLLANLGAVATERGDFSVASERIGEGMQLASELEGSDVEILLLINRAELAKQQGNRVAAISDLETAQALATEADHQHYLAEIERRLAAARG